LLQAFRYSSQENSTGDQLYFPFYEKSFIRNYAITKIPFTLRDTKKDCSLEYSPIGFKKFYPWFVSDNNPAAMAEYFNVVMELLKVTDEAIKNEEYWFFRADVNVVMAWLRVQSSTNSF